MTPTVNLKKPALLLLGLSLTLPLSAADLTQFIWSGAVGTSGATVLTKTYSSSTNVRLQYATSADFSDAQATDAIDTVSASNFTARFRLTGLVPSTRYHYRIQVDGVNDDRTGAFTTFTDGAFSFKFALSACAGDINGNAGGGGSNHVVFDNIRNREPLFYMNMGDLHYYDISVNDVGLFRTAFESIFTAPRQQALYASTPIVYMWDDHDFGPNNSNASSPSREAAQLTYREYVPHYDLPAGDGARPVYQAFTVGRVRVILSDLRSAKGSGSMMGTEQKAWFKNEILASSQTHALVVWVTSVPWIAAAGSSSDDWAGFTAERAELANYFHDNGITNLLAVAGDAHMVALDDGTNNAYNDAGEPAFPVFHAAALDRSGSVKGGPYSHGTFSGRGQYGIVDISDNGGDSITVTCIGYDANNTELVNYSFTASVNDTSGGGSEATNLSVQVSASEDDVEEYESGEIDLTSTDIELVRDDTGSRGNMTIGLRFANLNIPREALVQSAHIQFTTDETTTEATSLSIRAEAAASPSAFTSAAFNISTRNLTDAVVAWNPDAWSILNERGTAQQTPDLSAIVQELVDKGDWTSGNAVNFILTGTGKRVAYSYDRSSAEAASLVLVYFPRISRWRLDNFGSLENAGSAADLADPDRDGIANLLEYALGTDPNSSASVSATAITFDANQPNFEFQRIGDEALTYTVNGGSDVSNWTDIWSIQGAENVPGPVFVPAPQPLAAGDRYFMRLQVSR